MDTLTVKIPRALNRQLRDKAKMLGRSKSELAREWIENALRTAQKPACAELMKDSCGIVPGEKGGSLKEGFDE